MNAAALRKRLAAARQLQERGTTEGERAAAGEAVKRLEARLQTAGESAAGPPAFTPWADNIFREAARAAASRHTPPPPPPPRAGRRPQYGKTVPRPRGNRRRQW